MKTRSTVAVSDRSDHPADFSWKDRLAVWLRLKLLEQELRESERFQKFCARNGCKNLAEVEANYQEKITRQIKDLKSSFEKI
jgi:hypothetical protein